MNDYEAKQEARKQRMLDRADRLRKIGNAKVESGMKDLRAIPFGQPILVGHHSEKRDRSYRAKAGARIDRGMEALQAAGEVEARAAAVGTGGISSDDPDATAKLREQLEKCQAVQARMIAANKIVRKFKAEPKNGMMALEQAGFTAGQAQRLFEPDYIGRLGFPSFELANNGANVRRIEQRIAHLARNAARVTTQRDVAGVRVVENAELNRLQLIFPGKPPQAIRTLLKRSGFRWAPSEGAWQKHLNGWSAASAGYILAEIEKLNNPTQPAVNDAQELSNQ